MQEPCMGMAWMGMGKVGGGKEAVGAAEKVGGAF
jgi:hypothetical protein